MLSGTVRRGRGALLRLVQARVIGALVGGVLLTCSAILFLFDLSWEFWLTDGLGLVCGGTGAAILMFALGSRRPDWIDPDTE